LNDIEFIEKPIFDFNIDEICLLFKIVVLIIFRSLKRKVKFLNDPQIPVEKVNQTCERCPLDNSQCSE